MKVKKIFCRKYDHPWHESALEYEKEISYFRRSLPKGKNLSDSEVDKLFLIFRNTVSSVNSWDIQEVDVPNPAICQLKFRLDDYERWDYYVHSGASKFCHKYGLWPEILCGNSKSMNKVKDHIKASFGAVASIDQYELTHFFCPEFDTHFFIDENLKDDRFNLVYSEKAVQLKSLRLLTSALPKILATREFGHQDCSQMIPYWTQTKVTSDFVELFYNLKLTINFDWMKWDEGMEMLKDPDFDFHSIDLETKQRLLTLIIRRERFAEGSLIAAFESKKIQKILSAICEDNLIYESSSNSDLTKSLFLIKN